MKKLQKFLIITFAALMFNMANALEIIDVRGDHWAGKEIVHALQNDYIRVVDGNKFVPEGTMSRSEFITSLMKVLQKQNDIVNKKTDFKDITNKTPNKRSIVLSEQIRIAFGYPDSTFKPSQPINHNETMSLIANITKENYNVGADITRFADYKEIPIWARRAYIKNVANGLYINYPDGDRFTPKKNLTRAEAAVLFDRVANNMAAVKNSYKDLVNNADEIDLDDDSFIEDGFQYDKSKFIAENNFNQVPFATNNKVKLYNNKKVIEAGNILVGIDMTKVKTRKDLIGHIYTYTAPSDVYSKEGVFLYPKGTEFYARVMKIGYSAWRSKPEKSNFVFYKYSMPNGEAYDMAGVPLTKKGEKIVYLNSIKNEKQILDINNKKANQKQYVLDCAHQKSPLTEFNIDENKVIYILLNADLVIPQDETYPNLRTKPSLIEDISM